MESKNNTFSLLGDLGLNIHPTKGYHTTIQVGDYLGTMFDIKKANSAPPRPSSATSRLWQNS